jgi:hypothetical protein
MEKSLFETELDHLHRYDRCFEECRHLASQIGGLLLAESSVMKGKLPLQPLRVACQETFEQLKSQRASPGDTNSSDQHALSHIDRAVALLKTSMDALSDDLMLGTENCKNALAAAIRELRFAASTTLGLSMVDLTCACCAIPDADPNLKTRPGVIS